MVMNAKKQRQEKENIISNIFNKTISPLLTCIAPIQFSITLPDSKTELLGSLFGNHLTALFTTGERDGIKLVYQEFEHTNFDLTKKKPVQLHETAASQKFFMDGHNPATSNAPLIFLHKMRGFKEVLEKPDSKVIISVGPVVM